LTKRYMKTLLTAVLFCAVTVPARSQGVVLPDFVTVAEGVTSASRSIGIDAAYRMFSLSTFAKTCKESRRPFRLASPNTVVSLRVGEWFSLRRLMIVGLDRTGHVLRPLPIGVEVEDTNPPILNLRTDMISVGRGLLPIRTGRFRFRARTICEGTSADIFMQAVVRP
jgi:hypothetical protein